jgi:hypothetical protein
VSRDQLEAGVGMLGQHRIQPLDIQGHFPAVGTRPVGLVSRDVDQVSIPDRIRQAPFFTLSVQGQVLMHLAVDFLTRQVISVVIAGRLMSGMFVSRSHRISVSVQ